MWKFAVLSPVNQNGQGIRHENAVSPDIDSSIDRMKCENDSETPVVLTKTAWSEHLYPQQQEITPTSHCCPPRLLNVLRGCTVPVDDLRTNARAPTLFGRIKALRPSPSTTALFSSTQKVALKWRCSIRPTDVIEPSSLPHYIWLVVISIAILYNLTFTIARVVFKQLEYDYLTVWLVLDYSCDTVYLLDMLVRFRTGYLQDGILERDAKKLAKNYLYSSAFKYDLLSVLPTDVFMLIPAIGWNPVIRFNRLLRWQRLTEFFDRTVRRTSLPNLFRILNLILYIIIIIHWNACFYFALSGLIGYGTDGWVYPDPTNSSHLDSLNRKYVYSFYWSTLTLLTIGETPHPETDVEYLFVVVDFLVGVLIFATIIGNVGSMITNMNHDRSVFTQKLDAVKRYMKLRKVNDSLETKVVGWFEYLWTNRNSLDEEEVLDTLPEKLRAEIGIHVHMSTLRQMSLFKDCEPGLLVEMILKLKLQVFSPGDYVCRKGDIGREMYIVKKGILKVLTDNDQCLATLSDGNVFGEISILDIPGSKTGNRRMANVLSVGYSDCFVLSKNDLWTLLKDYPVTRQKLRDRGRDLLAQGSMLAEDRGLVNSNMAAFSTVSQCASNNQSSQFTNRLHLQEENLHSLNSRMVKHLEKLEEDNRELRDRITVLERDINMLMIRRTGADVTVDEETISALLEGEIPNGALRKSSHDEYGKAATKVVNLFKPNGTANGPAVVVHDTSQVNPMKTVE